MDIVVSATTLIDPPARSKFDDGLANGKVPRRE
jgi:hypothetical protein